MDDKKQVIMPGRKGLICERGNKMGAQRKGMKKQTLYVDVKNASIDKKQKDEINNVRLRLNGKVDIGQILEDISRAYRNDQC